MFIIAQNVYLHKHTFDISNIFQALSSRQLNNREFPLDILNHGSRGGIEGDIQPTSRLRCDFGKGFYLGDSDMQAKSLVINDQAPWFYKIRETLINELYGQNYPVPSNF